MFYPRLSRKPIVFLTLGQTIVLHVYYLKMSNAIQTHKQTRSQYIGCSLKD